MIIYQVDENQITTNYRHTVHMSSNCFHEQNIVTWIKL